MNYKSRVTAHVKVTILFPSYLPSAKVPLDIQKHYAEYQWSYFSFDEDDESNGLFLVTYKYHY